jgi:hypothetical protein
MKRIAWAVRKAHTTTAARRIRPSRTYGTALSTRQLAVFQTETLPDTPSSTARVHSVIPPDLERLDIVYAPIGMSSSFLSGPVLFLEHSPIASDLIVNYPVEALRLLH